VTQNAEYALNRYDVGVVIAALAPCAEDAALDVIFVSQKRTLRQRLLREVALAEVEHTDGSEAS
jgi:hypothetical protein